MKEETFIIWSEHESSEKPTLEMLWFTLDEAKKMSTKVYDCCNLFVSTYLCAQINYVTFDIDILHIIVAPLSDFMYYCHFLMDHFILFGQLCQ